MLFRIQHSPETLTHRGKIAINNHKNPWSFSMPLIAIVREIKRKNWIKQNKYDKKDAL